MAEYEDARAIMLAALLPTGTDVYVALFEGDPSGSGTEITLAGYARVAYQNWSTSVPGVGESTRDNAGLITFPTINAVGTADYWAIFDSAVGGVLLSGGQLLDDLGQPFPININVGDDVQFNIGALRNKVVEE